MKHHALAAWQRWFCMKLEHVHFNRGNKARYRLHVTCWACATVLLPVIGLAIGAEWLGYGSVATAIITNIIWIWE